MTLLDHSRARERDAVAKTRPTTDSDTVVVRAPAGSLGVFVARDASHRVTGVRSGSPLAGEVAVGDRLVSISTPGRALFTCGPTATGLDIVDELRAAAIFWNRQASGCKTLGNSKRPRVRVPGAPRTSPSTVTIRGPRVRVRPVRRVGVSVRTDSHAPVPPSARRFILS